MTCSALFLFALILLIIASFWTAFLLCILAILQSLPSVLTNYHQAAPRSITKRHQCQEFNYNQSNHQSKVLLIVIAFFSYWKLLCFNLFKWHWNWSTIFIIFKWHHDECATYILFRHQRGREFTLYPFMRHWHLSTVYIESILIFNQHEYWHVTYLFLK